MSNPNVFELLDVGVLIFDLDMQKFHNNYRNDPEVDAFAEDDEHDEGGKQSNLSYQHMIV